MAQIRGQTLRGYSTYFATYYSGPVIVFKIMTIVYNCRRIEEMGTTFFLNICISSNRSPYVLNLSLFSQRVCPVSNTKLHEYYYYKNNN